MADHSGEPISVPLIAQTVGLGRQSLERRFHRHLGRTINNELIQLRVDEDFIQINLMITFCHGHFDILELGFILGFSLFSFIYIA